jgi:hypothetical protein
MACRAMHLCLLRGLGHPGVEVHEIACGIALRWVLERHVEIGRMPENVHQRPKRKTPRRVGFQPEIDGKAPSKLRRVRRR